MSHRPSPYPSHGKMELFLFVCATPTCTDAFMMHRYVPKDDAEPVHARSHARMPDQNQQTRRKRMSKSVAADNRIHNTNKNTNARNV